MSALRDMIRQRLEYQSRQKRLIPFTQDLLYVAAGALWRRGRARLIEPVKIAIVASSGTIPIAQVALYVVLA
jgi:hypothetical protein